MQRGLTAAIAAAAERPRNKPGMMAKQDNRIALKLTTTQQSAGMAMPGALEKPAAASPSAMERQHGTTWRWRLLGERSESFAPRSIAGTPRRLIPAVMKPM